MAYTLNEALCGRNKYVVGFQGGKRTYRNVQISEIVQSGGHDPRDRVRGRVGRRLRRGPRRRERRGVQEPPSRVPVPRGQHGHRRRQVRPVGDRHDEQAPQDHATDLWLNSDSTHSLDIIKDYGAGKYTADGRGSRLDWVGRNHGNGEKPTDNKSNFLYLDGHVETKTSSRRSRRTAPPRPLGMGPAALLDFAERDEPGVTARRV